MSTSKDLWKLYEEGADAIEALVALNILTPDLYSIELNKIRAIAAQALRLELLRPLTVQEIDAIPDRTLSELKASDIFGLLKNSEVMPNTKSWDRLALAYIETSVKEAQAPYKSGW